MLIRKNTKAFKAILEIVSTCQHRPDREKLIRLYITRPGHSIQDRISVEGIQGESGLFYEMNYQTVLNSLKSSGHQLNLSDDVEGIYFFHSNSNKQWEETPFEFDEAIKKEFASLPELPVTRKKGKVQKVSLPVTKSGDKNPPSKKTSPKEKKEKTIKTDKKPSRRQDATSYRLKRKIEFSQLDRILYRQPHVTKRDVLDYYDKIADIILPHLKGRAITLREYSSDGPGRLIATAAELFEDNPDKRPDWLRTHKRKSKDAAEALTCPDKEHLMLYGEMGAVEFRPSHAKTQSPDSPDYFVIGVESAEEQPEKLTESLDVAEKILGGLQLPSVLKSDGAGGGHIYVPLDSKGDFQSAESVAGFICKLIRLKIPDHVALKVPDLYAYGKVSLDPSVNDREKNVVAPYSLVAGPVLSVALPLAWKEARVGIAGESFSLKDISGRTKKGGDPFNSLFKKKFSSKTLLDRLEKTYGFLL